VRLNQLGDVPDSVTVHTWVPRADLLTHVDAVVHHGGNGTTLCALIVGAPQLILPQGADQFANAAALSAAGAAVRLLPDELSGGHRRNPNAVADRTDRPCPVVRGDRRAAMTTRAVRARVHRLGLLAGPALLSR
jgi:hypothetical protein